MTSYYLLDNQNPNAPVRANGKRMWAYPSRSNSVLACVVHITAGLEDLDGVDDHSAERVAHYAATTDRAVSWHSGSDTDSNFQLLPDSFTAFHVRGYNSRTIGHEISKRHVDWSVMPKEWVTASLSQAANCLRPRLERLGIPLRHATKAELDRAIQVNGKPVGLIDHSRLDPTRRSDPGANFPWTRFISMLVAAPQPTPEPTPTPAPIPEDDMKYERFILDGVQQYLATPEGLITIRSQQHLALLRKANLVSDNNPISITQEEVGIYGVLP